MTTTPGPGDEPPSRVPVARVTSPPEPPTDRDDVQIRGGERRLEDIVSTIQEFAALRFRARSQIGQDGDIVDAVAAGVNFLGEELEASFSEMERRVADRTAELAMATEELRRQALHDELTGLPNRALFWERLSHRMSMAARRPTGFAVLFLDLDDFKTVNDTLGHAAGDQLLVDVAAHIRAEVRAGDTAARVGGDEFIVMLDEVVSTEAALIIAHRLAEALRTPLEIGTDQRITMASIGIAMGPENFETADAMVAAADAAMYDAKRHGPGRCVVYSKDHQGQAGLHPEGDDDIADLD